VTIPEFLNVLSLLIATTSILTLDVQATQKGQWFSSARCGTQVQQTVMEKNTDHTLAPEPGAKNARPIPKKAAEYRLNSHETVE
jgi:hypothetical protein